MSTTPVLTFATDCSGIDAPLHALQSLAQSVFKIEYVFASEIDPDLRSLLQSQEPTPQQVFEDLKHRDNSSVSSSIDLYVAGFPCQSFSHLGKKLGFDDKQRGSVFFHINAFIQTCQPRVFVLENVQRLTQRQSMETVFKALNASGHYQVVHQVISPTDLGFPHLRHRLFIMGMHRSKNSADQLMRFRSTFPVATYPTHDRTLQTILCTSREAAATDPQSFRSLTTTLKSNLDAMLAEQAVYDDNVILNIGTSANFRSQAPVGVCPCITTQCFNFYYVKQGRYLTYRDMLRLQGFDDEFAKQICGYPKAKRNRWAGNTMSVPVLELLLDALLEIIIRG